MWSMEFLCKPLAIWCQEKSILLTTEKNIRSDVYVVVNDDIAFDKHSFYLDCLVLSGSVQ